MKATAQRFHSLAMARVTAHANHGFSTALSPVAEFPVELVVLIFSYLRSISPPKFYEARPCPDLGWITVTQVCRRWRHIAFQARCLWSDVAFSLGAEWAGLMMRRSHPMPLVMRARMPGLRGWQLSEKVTETMNACMFRATELRLLVAYPKTKAILETLTSPAPKLTELHIKITIPSTYGYDFPTAFLGGVAPSLRRLNINSTQRFPWEHAILGAQLTELTMRYASLETQPLEDLPLFDCLLDTLRALPSLEYLALDAVFFMPTDDEPRMPAVLPHLENLELRVLADAAPALFSALALPARTTVRIDAAYDRMSELEDGWLPDFMQTLTGALCLGGPAPPRTRMHAWARASVVSVTTSGTADTVEPDIRLIFQPEAWQDAALPGRWLSQHAAAMLASADLENLVINDDGWDNEALARLPHLPKLCAVDARGDSAVDLCMALYHMPAPDEAGPAVGRTSASTTSDKPEQWRYIMPALSSLRLRCVDFAKYSMFKTTCGDGIPGERLPLEDAEPFSDALPRWLRWRAYDGYPLEKLHLDQCKVDSEFLEKLRAIPGLTVLHADKTV
ncbi:hypothetical protein FA95DRAFT_124279 [Auriscalpium vulgare]|uniref:Uncharacterized protein n=1 Tax=Auriscalpium vulgare TaxID=40419 RepID=A0ACB8RN38_9AGAM|nr:hypothetical protein FA95DRAFT_124279 [Auriscalpium vulgare]